MLEEVFFEKPTLEELFTHRFFLDSFQIRGNFSRVFLNFLFGNYVTLNIAKSPSKLHVILINFFELTLFVRVQFFYMWGRCLLGLFIHDSNKFVPEQGIFIVDFILERMVFPLNISFPVAMVTHYILMSFCRFMVSFNLQSFPLLVNSL